VGVCYHAHARFLDAHGNRVTVPAPVDANSGDVPWWYDHIAHIARSLRDAGFTAVLLPPPEKTQSGSANTGDGYGAYDHYDLGAKDQCFSRPTRFGSREQLQRATAVAHACDLDVYADFVMHQVIGGEDGVYRYLGADGRSKNGRFPKNPGCFRGAPPRRPEDPVPVRSTDFAFGDEFVFKNCDPSDYTVQHMIAWGDWLVRTLDLQGGRVDDTKGMWAEFVAKWMTSGSMAGKFFVSEYFDGNPDALEAWARGPPMNGRSAVFDFTLHWALQNICDHNGDMRSLEGAGYSARDPFGSVTFVDNPDTDVSPGEGIIASKLLAYAYILTTEGYPFVYHKDYAEATGCYGLRPWIDNLVWIHENLANGPTVIRYADDRVFVHERTGYPNLLTAISSDPVKAREITCSTGFGSGVRLHDYTGRHPDVFTDRGGRVTFEIPSNALGKGQSYLCFSRPGCDRARARPPRMTHQTFFCADDLDIAPITDGSLRVGRIWCAAGTQIRAQLRPETTGWTAAPKTAVRLSVIASDGGELAACEYALDSGREVLTATTRSDGWHALLLTGSSLPGTGSPFGLEVTYLATQEFA
jgi:alpha-amylase